MRNRKAAYLLATAVGVLLAGGQGQAGETVTYTYDTLGRLVASSSTGSVNNGITASTSYDAAGNRTNHMVGGVGGQPAPPPSGNLPPIAAADYGNMTRCEEKSFSVLSNDSDPENNTPLALVSVAGGTPKGTPSISGADILFTPSGATGTASVSYVVRDSLGATATGTLTISISAGSCTE